MGADQALIMPYAGASVWVHPHLFIGRGRKSALLAFIASFIYQLLSRVYHQRADCKRFGETPTHLPAVLPERPSFPLSLLLSRPSSPSPGSGPCLALLSLVYHPISPGSGLRPPWRGCQCICLRFSGPPPPSAEHLFLSPIIATVHIADINAG